MALDLSGVADSLITAFGFPLTLTLTRTAVVDYDAVNNLDAPPNPQSWTVRAGWGANKKGNATDVVDSDGTITYERVLLISGASCSVDPQAGDAFTVGAFVYYLGNISRLGDFSGGTVAVWRCEVSI
jgi:hypothetical protein